LALILLPAWREAVGWLGFVLEARQRVLFLGTSETGVSLCRELLGRKDLRFDIVGFLDEDRKRVGESIVNPAVIGTIDEVTKIVEREQVDRVVVSLENRRGCLPVRDLLKLRTQGVIVEDAHTLHENVTGRISLDSLSPSLIIFSGGFRRPWWRLFLKRLFDVTAALLGVVLSFPLMVVAAIWIKLDSRGPMLFRQERVGQFGRSFDLIKLRSMTVDAEASGEPRWATVDDARITRAGQFLRRFRLDELPQFFNILRGDMSFVGPRPERPYFVARLEETLDFYQDRHLIKPGLTGWAQVNFTYASSEEESRQKLEYDFFYVKNFSLLLDLVIIFRTAKIVLGGKGAR
jgi:sugar transferase (PEP-CTERM system associated)